jgi:eukaryotic-like serine/threonine-protein kinase
MIETKEKLPVPFGSVYLVDLIGKGGMAEIFLAKAFNELGTEQLSVVKRILPGLSDRPGFGEMLIAEAKLCSRLSHANVVQTFDLGQIDGQYYIGMEYVEGFDLNRLLGLCARAKLPMPLEFALFIIMETLRGLDYAHRVTDDDGNVLGIIHRDVSPTNVLISVDGDVKVCDFGIAKVTQGDDAEDIVDEYHMKGKVAYMAPEHLNGKPVDVRSDLYAVGILLWELLSGRRLFKSKDEADTLKRAKAADVPPLQDRGFSDFKTLSGIVKKALAKKPADRFQTGREFIDAIDDYKRSVGLIVSSIKFSEFLMDNFGEDLVQQRTSREQKLTELLATKEPPEPEEAEKSDGETEAAAPADEAPDDARDDDDEPTESGDPEEETDEDANAIPPVEIETHAEAGSPAQPVADKNDANRKKRSLIAAAAVIVIAIAGAVAAFYFGQ